MRGNVIYIVYCHTHIIILQPIIRRLCIYHCRLLVLTINRIILAWRSRIYISKIDQQNPPERDRAIDQSQHQHSNPSKPEYP